MSEVLIKQLSETSNRIIITQDREFNPKRKKENIVLADIRSDKIVREFSSTIKIDSSRKADPGWMTEPEVYVNFLEDKLLVFSLGLLIGIWVRSRSWEGDYVINNPVWFHE